MALTVARDHLLNKLRQLGCKFVRRHKHVDLWRRPGDNHRVPVPRSKHIAVEAVVSLLRQAGCSEDEIRSFIQMSQA